MGKLLNLYIRLLHYLFRSFELPSNSPQTAQNAPVSPVPAPAVPNPTPMPTVPPTVPESEVLKWSTPKEAFHSTRVIADEMGLTLVQKNVLCACLFQESRFDNNAVCLNRDKSGRVWSRDISLVQVNTYFHIGPGKEFPSEDYVLSHPEACVRWMAGILKRTGGLAPWVSWSSGAYRRWLSTDSPMWALAS